MSQNANRPPPLPPPLMPPHHPFGPRIMGLPSPPRGNTRMPTSPRLDGFQPPFSPLMMRPAMIGGSGMAAKPAAIQGNQMQAKSMSENFRCIWCQDRFSTLSELADHLKEAKHGDVSPTTAAGFRPVTNTPNKVAIPSPFPGNTKKGAKRALTPAGQSSKNNSGNFTYPYQSHVPEFSLSTPDRQQRDVISPKETCSWPRHLAGQGSRADQADTEVYVVWCQL